MRDMFSPLCSARSKRDRSVHRRQHPMAERTHERSIPVDRDPALRKLSLRERQKALRREPNDRVGGQVLRFTDRRVGAEADLPGAGAVDYEDDRTSPVKLAAALTEQQRQI